MDFLLYVACVTASHSDSEGWSSGVSMHRIAIVVLLFALAACGDDAGEAREEVGILVGFQASMGLEQAMSGDLADMEFGGVLILELDDGTQVEALASEQILNNELTGGDEFRIQYDEDNDVWTVLERLAQ